MKREYPELGLENFEFLSQPPRRIWTVFRWLRCVACQLQFRREWGWRAVTGPFYGGIGFVQHVCATCAPTPAAAVRVLFGGREMEPPRGGTGVTKHASPLAAGK